MNKPHRNDTLRSQSRQSRPLSRPRRPLLELLERREVLTSALYLDFGDSFPAAGLTMTAANLSASFANGGLQGPSLVDKGAKSDPIVASDTLAFQKFSTVVDFDYDNNGAINQLDYTTLRQDILTSIKRYYAPFDVIVQIAPALGNSTSAIYRQNVLSRLQMGQNVDGERDAWVFVSAITYQASGKTTSVGSTSGLNGIAAGADLGSTAEPNARDDSSLTFADKIIGSLKASSDLASRRAADNRIAYTAAHEAGHTFGLWHTWNGSSDGVSSVKQGAAGTGSITIGGDATGSLIIGEKITALKGKSNLGQFTIRAGSTFDSGTGRTTINVQEAVGATAAMATKISYNYQTNQFLLRRSDVIPGATGDDNRVNYDFFTRFPLVGDTAVPFAGNSSAYRPYNLLARTENLGLKPNQPAYVTGSGAADLISISPINASNAIVSITAYRNSDLTGKIQTISYAINTSNGVLVDAGFGDDQIVVDGSHNYPLSVTLRGMQGSDRLRVYGDDEVDATYSPYGAAAPRVPGSSLPATLDEKENYRGTVKMGQATVSFSEWETSGVVMIDHVDQVTFVTPNSKDDITVESNLTGTRTRVRGSSNSVQLVSLEMQYVKHLVVDALLRDLGGADLITVAALPASGPKTITVSTGLGKDSFNITPSVAAEISVLGGLPVPLLPTGDKFELQFSGVTNPQLTPGVQGSGKLTFGNRKPVNYQSIEEPNIFDFGDLPISFGGTLETAGPRHRLGANLRLGLRSDPEPDGQPTPLAIGDDTNGSPDDEDGVVLPTTLIAHMRAAVRVTASAAAKLDAWIDFNRDGNFDLSDRIATSLSVAAGVNIVTFMVPANALPGDLGARFRLSSTGGLTPLSLAKDGEVEDYRVHLEVVEPGAARSFEDPLTPGGSGHVLVFAGTAAKDSVLFQPAPDNNITVLLNRTELGTFRAITRLGAYGGVDDDTIVAAAQLALSAEFYGDEGIDSLSGAQGADDLDGGSDNDTIYGGPGHDFLSGGPGSDSLYGEGGDDVLLGDTGDDFLFGGDGRDVVIGGTGLDSLRSEAGTDILIGGFTDFDNNRLALQRIRAEWSSNRTYSERIVNILQGTGPFLLGTGVQWDATTVDIDGVVDELFGGSDADWFFNLSNEDDINDDVLGETVT